MNANPDVNMNGAGPGEGSSTSQNPSVNDPNVGGQPLNGGSEPGHEESVSYERFKETNEAKKAAEDQLKAMQDQLNSTQEAYRTLAQQAVQQVSAPPQQNMDPQPDPNEEMVRQMLGNDETGQKAYEAIDKLATMRANNATAAQQQNMYQIADQIANQKVASLTSGMQTEKTLGAWKSAGLITGEDEKRISDKMDQMMVDTPQWGNQQDLLLKYVFGELSSQGEIKGRVQPNGPPLQPGGGAPPSATPEQDLAVDIQNRFRSLKGKSLDDVKKTVGDDLFRVPDDTESEILRGSYRMEK
jgi:hypothetical protein